MIEQVAKDLYEGKIKPADLNQELISQTYKELNEAAAKGYGKNWTNPTGKDTLPNELRKNLYTFSAAKNYAQLVEINKLLIDQDGKIRPFNEFSQLAKKVGEQFNKNYLQAEYQTARTAAQMAEKWQRLQESKDLFPNLKYRTVGDDRVRPEHERLNGIIKPIDDSFWNRYYPPLDWRCRCDVVATAEDTTEENEKDLPQPVLKGNVAKDKEIFTKKGTFFRLVNTDEKAKENMEYSKLNAPYMKRTTRLGKTVFENIFADRSENEYKDNLEVASLIVDELGFKAMLRPHILIKGRTNPEYYIKGKAADRKSPEGLSFRNILNKANYQGCELVVIDLNKNNNTIEAVENQLMSNFRFDTNYQNIREIIIVSKDRKTIKHYYRDDFKKKKGE